MALGRKLVGVTQPLAKTQPGSLAALRCRAAGSLGCEGALPGCSAYSPGHSHAAISGPCGVG